MTTGTGLGRSGEWWHIIQLAWTASDIKNWISQIAIPTQVTANGIHYRTSNGSPGKEITNFSWIKLLDTSNYTSYCTPANIGAAASDHNHNSTYCTKYPTGGYSSMNAVAALNNAMGMTNLSSDSTGLINPKSVSNWSHFINMSYNTESTNMWQTQFVNKAGTTVPWIRSRSGGSVSDSTAWTAPWTRIMTGTNYCYIQSSQPTGPTTWYNTGTRV